MQFDGVPEEVHRALFRVKPSCETPQRVLDLSDYRFAGSAWFGIGLDGAPMALLRPADEIFALDWKLRRKMPL